MSEIKQYLEKINTRFGNWSNWAGPLIAISVVIIAFLRS